jgi:hypothetical protein
MRAGLAVMTLRQRNNPSNGSPDLSKPIKVRLKSKVRSMLIIFFDIKGNVQNEFILTGQTVNSVYYRDVLQWLRENVRRLRPELWRQKNWLLHHNNAPSHTSIFADKNNMTVIPHPPHFPLLPWLKTKLKDCRIETM